MLVSGVMALGINVAEGSKEGEDSPEKAQEKMTVAPVAKLSAKEVEDARSIINFCRKQLLQDGGKNRRGETIGQTFSRKLIEKKLEKKMNIPFVYTFQCKRKSITSLTTLNDEFLFMIKYIQALERHQVKRWPKTVDDIMCFALALGDPDILRTSLKMGSDPNKLSISKTFRGVFNPNEKVCDEKPLLWVLIHYPGEKELVKILVEHGASVNNDIDKQPQYLSLATKNGDIESVRILLENGANPNLRGLGPMPLNWAVDLKYTDIALLLLEHGANPNIGKSPSIFDAIYDNNVKLLEKLIEAGADIEACNEFGIKPVEASALLPREEAMKCLLDHGANIFSAWCWCRRDSKELDRRMKKIKQIFSIPLDPTKDGERERAIENLKKVRRVEDREKCLFNLIGAENIIMSLFPCDLITDRLVSYFCHTWYVVHMHKKGVHLPAETMLQPYFSFANIEELRQFHEAIADEIEELDEEYKRRFESVFERIAEEIKKSETSTSSDDEDVGDSTDDVEGKKEVKETPEASISSVNKDSEASTEDDKNGKQEGKDSFEVIRRAPRPYVNIAMEVVTQPGPERRGPRSQGVSKHASKSSSDREAVVEDSAKEEKKVKEKKVFYINIDYIFKLYPNPKELEVQEYTEVEHFIKTLCSLLKQAGLECDLEPSKGHKKLVVKNFPPWAEDLKAYKMPNRISLPHGSNTIYSNFFDEIISYLFHGLCLLAQSKNPKAAEALELLKKYARERNLNTLSVLDHYEALIPHFLKFKGVQ